MRLGDKDPGALWIIDSFNWCQMLNIQAFNKCSRVSLALATMSKGVVLPEQPNCLSPNDLNIALPQT